MTNFDLQILEWLGLKRCGSLTYLRCIFPDASRSNLSKRLKKMTDDGFLGRKEILEPITQRMEFAYFLAKSGALELANRSLKFASIEEIDMPRNYSILRHDLAVNWFSAFLDRDKKKYLEAGWLEKLEFESRRSKIFSGFQNQNLLPDAVLSVLLCKRLDFKKFLIEMDNSTENRKAIHHKLQEYQKFLKQNSDTLLVVIVQHSEKRLAFLSEIAFQLRFPENSIFLCTLPELNTFSFFSNIWTVPEWLFRSYRNGNKVIPIMRCNEISERDRFCLPL